MQPGTIQPAPVDLRVLTPRGQLYQKWSGSGRDCWEKVKQRGATVPVAGRSAGETPALLQLGEFVVSVEKRFETLLPLFVEPEKIRLTDE